MIKMIFGVSSCYSRNWALCCFEQTLEGAANPVLTAPPSSPSCGDGSLVVCETKTSDVLSVPVSQDLLCASSLTLPRGREAYVKISFGFGCFQKCLSRQMVPSGKGMLWNVSCPASRHVCLAAQWVEYLEELSQPQCLRGEDWKNLLNAHTEIHLISNLLAGRRQFHVVELCLLLGQGLQHTPGSVQRPTQRSNSPPKLTHKKKMSNPTSDLAQLQSLQQISFPKDALANFKTIPRGTSACCWLEVVSDAPCHHIARDSSSLPLGTVAPPA